MKCPAVLGIVGSAWTLLAAFVSGQETPAATPIDDPEAYAVYAALLADHWLVQHARATTLLLQQETTDRLSSCLPSGGPLETDWRPVIENYTAVNATVHTVLAGYGLGRPVARGQAGWRESVLLGVLRAPTRS